MFTSIIAFLGGNVFRLIFGEIAAFFTQREEHKNELERMKLQSELDQAQHAMNMDALRVQNELQIKVVGVQAEAAISEIEAQGWLEAVKGTAMKVGIAWVDAWNAVIRPAVATWSVVMITGNYLMWWKLDDNGWSIAGAALGIYLADRSLFKRGK